MVVADGDDDHELILNQSEPSFFRSKASRFVAS
jgi:hypothetical protein